MTEEQQVNPCPLCKQPAQMAFDPRNRVVTVQCQACGTYRADYNFVQQSEEQTAKPLLSGIIRRNSDQGMTVTITGENAKALEEPAPKSMKAKTHELLISLGKRAGNAGTTIIISSADCPLAFASSYEEFVSIVRSLKGLGYLEPYMETGTGIVCALTAKAWEKLEESTKPGEGSDRVFVAMWFYADLKSAYDEGIAPAVQAAGYAPIRIDIVEHNNKIDEEIFSEIKKSRFLIADFTGNRGGVYYEAGFAKGFGIDVIWTCNAAEIGTLHFDTRQYNHIGWTSAKDLREKLTTRILKTIGPGPNSR